MREKLLPLLLLCALSGAGCPSGGGDNRAGVLRDPSLKAVQLAVQEVNGEIVVAVAPKLIKISRRNHKLRFSAFNNLDQDISRIEVDFGSDNPFDGDFNIVGIDSGVEDDSPKRKARENADLRTYKYDIKVFINGNVPVKIDPEVEIMN